VTDDSIVELVKKDPKGLRVEQIRAELAIDKRELARPLEAALGRRTHEEGQHAHDDVPLAVTARSATGGSSCGDG
jgi:hypothetical protein